MWISNRIRNVESEIVKYRHKDRWYKTLLEAEFYADLPKLLTAFNECMPIRSEMKYGKKTDVPPSRRSEVQHDKVVTFKTSCHKYVMVTMRGDRSYLPDLAVCLSPCLTKMLGLADHFQLMEKNPDVQTIYFDGNEKPNIWCNKQYLYLYVNFIQPEIVGNKEMYLLEVIPNLAVKYAISNIVKNQKLSYHELSDPLLNSRLVLYLKDEATNTVRFIKPYASMVIMLHFRRRRMFG